MNFIDYENLIDNIALQVAAKSGTTTNNVKLTKGIKRCDFIAYDVNGKSVFILNELSQSGDAESKFRDAKNQLRNAVEHLHKCTQTKEFIEGFAEKKCIFSNKEKTIKTPDDIAEAFIRISAYLPEPLERDYQPITKYGFKLIEAAVIEL